MSVTRSRHLSKYQSPVRGYCVIINNLTPCSSERESIVTALKNVFCDHLGFIVIVHESCSAPEIREALQQVQAYDHSQHSALVVVGLSPGATSGILGTDGVEVPLKKIASYFSKSRCPALMGKPKVVIFQTCNTNSDAVQALDGSPSHQEVYPAITPDFADFLCIHSTVPDGQSRWSFMQAFATALKIPHMKSFLEILFEVNSTCTGQQVAEVISTLRYRLLIAPVDSSGESDEIRTINTVSEELPGYC